MEARHMVAGSRFLEKPFEVGQLAILMRAVMCGAIANLMAETWVAAAGDRAQVLSQE